MTEYYKVVVMEDDAPSIYEGRLDHVGRALPETIGSAGVSLEFSDGVQLFYYWGELTRIVGGASDPVKEPEHYTAHPSGIETIEITRHESFLRGNVLKYVLRAPYKGNELEDLLKAQQYLEWEVERVRQSEQAETP